MGPLARDLRVLIGWPFPLGFGLDGRLLLARRGRVCVKFIIITILALRTFYENNLVCYRGTSSEAGARRNLPPWKTRRTPPVEVCFFLE